MKVEPWFELRALRRHRAAMRLHDAARPPGQSRVHRVSGGSSYRLDEIVRTQTVRTPGAFLRHYQTP